MPNAPRLTLTESLLLPSRAFSCLLPCRPMVAALTKGASYAEELERWAAVFSRSQLRVIHTDELSDPRSAQRLMDDLFRFLGLPAIPIGNQTRM